jgi:hypothetical protein
MKKSNFLFLHLTYVAAAILFNYNITYAQIENVPAGNPVYSFLKQMQVQGILNDYSDVILPLSRKKVLEALRQVDKNKDKISSTDRKYLERLKKKLDFYEEKSISSIKTDSSRSGSIFDNFPADFPGNFFTDSEKHLYSYNDRNINFYINPVVEYKYINSSFNKNNSSLFNLGGVLRGSYNDWFGFYLLGTNGIVSGNRDVAELDKRVRQSYTFNDTKINYFPYTEGYARVEKGIVSLQIGRERVLWGTGYINRLILSENPPPFDFIRFNISYKSLSYNFLHGWLVQKPTLTILDSLGDYFKTKGSKYIAMSRLGFRPNNKLSLGITQMIIYSNRPLEAAYLTPFLFFESAQRSLNDLDNSFLSFDGRYLITPGIEVNSSIIFDDINFKRLAEGQWNASNNGTAWQIGTIITDPILLSDLVFKMEYIQIRPYMYSHPGLRGALTYTNNGYLLSPDIQPNSTHFSTEIDYRFSSELYAQLNYSHELHGNNIYDSQGNLIKNVGGDVFQNKTFFDSYFADLLDGEKATTDVFTLSVDYEFLYGFYGSLTFQYKNKLSNGLKTTDNILSASLRLSFE